MCIRDSLLIALPLTVALTACGDDDDDDDDNDDNDTGDDDNEEDPCIQETRDGADAYCASLGKTADQSRMGLGASLIECQFYCGEAELYWNGECRDGACLCCEL